MSDLLVLDRGRMAADFPHRPFPIRHGLSDHPLFSLTRIVELARRMDRDRIEYSSGKLAVDQDPDAIPEIELTAEETIRRIEEAGAWMVIKNVEADPEYRAVLEAVLAEARAAAGLDDGAMADIRGFLFVSSAGSTTPFHVDAEHNLFVQIHGDKAMHIFDNEDRSLVSEQDMEITPSKHRNQRYRPEFEDRARVFEMTEGDGVFLPYMWPHWVATGGRYCISLAITWKSPEVERLNKIRFMNGFLRQVGMPQAGPATHPALDKVKVLAFDAAHALIDPLRKSERARRVIRQLLFGRKANYYYKA
jgi:ribosomal protein L16 Arg81 hydroxylase